MKTKLFIAFAVLLSVSTINVSAQKNRNFRDENREIRQGVKSGQLTSREAKRLKTERATLRDEAYRYKANDGRISARERADLRRDNRRLNENICRQRNDKQRRI
jgi:hypothetical protein